MKRTVILITAAVVCVCVFAVTGCGSKPSVTSVKPESARTGSQVIITGTGFGADEGSSNAYIGAKQADVVSWSDTKLQVSVPDGLSPGNCKVTVKTSAGESNAFSFTVLESQTASFPTAEQLNAVDTYLKSNNISTDGWTWKAVKVSSIDKNWMMVEGDKAGKITYFVMVFNNMAGGWEVVSMGTPPWTGVDFKGQAPPADLNAPLQ